MNIIGVVCNIVILDLLRVWKEFGENWIELVGMKDGYLLRG